MRLEMRDLACGHDRAHPTLRYVNCAVESGEVCCVLGPNGVGKSTLFRTVLGIDPPLGGQVLIDGEDVARWSPARMAAQVAYVSQAHTPPFAYLVRDVVMLGRLGKVGPAGSPSAQDRLIVENTMAEMGVQDLRDVPYTELSGGELQLVMIARALAQQPRMLLLDEPTAALDYGNVARVVGKVRELAASGVGVLMTTHSPDHAFMCGSKVLLLLRDEPPVFGDATEVITDRTMRRAYGVGVRVVEYVSSDGEVIRMCAPEFS